MSTTSPEHPTISVIVPAWNAEGSIGRLLDALAAQSAAANRFETILVDNGSTDATCEIVRSYPVVRLLSEPQPGSYRARNRGVNAARGTFLLFTDADCLPAEDWVETALAFTRRSGPFGIVAGAVEFIPPGAGDPTGAERFENLFSLRQESNVRAGHCVTANWLCRKDELIELGGFDADMLSGGDVECSRRYVARGFPLTYAGSLIVRHPARAGLEALIAKTRRVAGGQWQMRQSAGPLTFVRELHRVLRGYTQRLAIVWRQPGGTSLRVRTTGVCSALALVELGEIVRLAFGARPFRS